MTSHRAETPQPPHQPQQPAEGNTGGFDADIAAFDAAAQQPTTEHQTSVPEEPVAATPLSWLTSATHRLGRRQAGEHAPRQERTEDAAATAGTLAVEEFVEPVSGPLSPQFTGRPGRATDEARLSAFASEYYGDTDHPTDEPLIVRLPSRPVPNRQGIGTDLAEPAPDPVSGAPVSGIPVSAAPAAESSRDSYYVDDDPTDELPQVQQSAGAPDPVAAGAPEATSAPSSRRGGHRRHVEPDDGTSLSDMIPKRLRTLFTRNTPATEGDPVENTPEPQEAPSAPARQPFRHRAPRSSRRANRTETSGDTREPSLWRDWRNWNLTGVAAYLTVRAQGYRGSEIGQVYNQNDTRSRRTLFALANIPVLAAATHAVWSLTRPAVEVVAAAYDVGHLPPKTETGILKSFIESAQTPGVHNSSAGEYVLASDTTDLLGNADPNALSDVADATKNGNYIDVNNIDLVHAGRVDAGEGWYHQLMHDSGFSQDQADSFMKQHGDEMIKRGLAYRMEDGSLGMNLGSSRADAIHDSTGVYNNFKPEDIQWFHDTMVADGLLPDTDFSDGNAGEGADGSYGENPENSDPNANTGENSGFGASDGEVNKDPNADPTSNTAGAGTDPSAVATPGTENVNTGNGGEYQPRHNADGVAWLELTAAGTMAAVHAAAGVNIARDAVRKARLAGLTPGRHRDLIAQAEVAAAEAEAAARGMASEQLRRARAAQTDRDGLRRTPRTRLGRDIPAAPTRRPGGLLGRITSGREAQWLRARVSRNGQPTGGVQRQSRRGSHRRPRR